MVRSTSARFFGLVCCAGLLFLVGCSGGKGVKVTGKVILPPKVTLEKEDNLTVSLSPTATDATAASTGVVNHSDMTFVITGSDNKGVPPGSYKVSVNCVPYPGSTDGAKRKKELDAAFAEFTGKKTTLTVELTADSTQQITVDLEKKSVSK